MLSWYIFLDSFSSEVFRLVTKAFGFPLMISIKPEDKLDKHDKSELKSIQNK